MRCSFVVRQGIGWWERWTVSGIESKGGVEERHFFDGGRLEDGGPAEEFFALYGRVLRGASLDALVKSIDGSGKEMELDGGALGQGFEA
jgi:hypothetical protein